MGAAHTRARVSRVTADSIQLDDGRQVHAGSIVVACEAPAAAELLGDTMPTAGKRVECLYFAAERPPIQELILVLNGDGEGPVNNLCVPSQVVSSYAPAGQSVLSVTVPSV